MPQASSARRHLTPSEAFSGLFVPQPQTRRKAAAVLARFDACMESFLEFWTLRMQAAGYLSFTTARRDDCVTACRDFLTPVLRHAAAEQPPTFETLRENAGGWADALLESGLRHCRRGVTVAMYLGCFKTFIMALEDALALGRAKGLRILMAETGIGALKARYEAAAEPMLGEIGTGEEEAQAFYDGLAQRGMQEMIALWQSVADRLGA